MNTIFLIDPIANGHHQTYLRFLTQTFLILGVRTVALCPDPAALKAWVKSQGTPHLDRLSCLEFDQKSRSGFSVKRLRATIDAVANWRLAAIAINQAVTQLKLKPDLVFFPWLDSYMGRNITHHIVDWVFPFKWSGIYFQPRHLRQVRSLSGLRRGPLNPHDVLNSPNCQSVAILDEGVAAQLQASIADKLVITFPDFADDSQPDITFQPVEKIREKAGDRKIIGLIGTLQKRKGLLPFLEIAQSNRLSDCFFVFAGKLSKGDFTPQELERIYQYIETDPPNCFFYLERIPDEPQFNALIAAFDILFAVYDYPHSSNILTKAALFEKYVIANNNFCIGERVSRYKLGVTVQPNATGEIAQAIEMVCDRLDQGTDTFAPQFNAYRSLHSLERLKQQMQHLLTYCECR